VLLSKYPILKADLLKFSNCAGMDCLSNKGAVYVQVSVPGVGPVDVLGTHLSSDGRDSLRSSQIRQVLSMLPSDETTGPILLAGDLNFHSESIPYSELVSEAGFRDSHAEYRAFHPGLSNVEWFGFSYDPSRNSNIAWLRPTSRSERLDYIWVKDGNCVRVDVHASGLLLDQKVEGLHLSDHFGVMTDLDFYREVSGSCPDSLAPSI
jgi:endonuclease/exonuclease/phosphatase family metal-dependent hydrolase